MNTTSPKFMISAVVAVVAVGALAFLIGRGNLQLAWNPNAPTVSATPSPTASVKPTTSPKVTTAPLAAKTSPSPVAAATGTITGKVSYPSEGIPPNMKVCAENQVTKVETCTTQANGTYSLNVPIGSYFVYAVVPSADPKYRAYYNVFVTCGLKYECKDHTPILVEVKAGQTASGVDPQDWYNQ